MAFDPIKLISELNIAREMNIENCIWQLGDNRATPNDTFSIKKYSDDLKTLKILCESVNKELNLKWNVAADDTLSHDDKIPFHVEGVEVKKFVTTGDMLCDLQLTKFYPF